MKHQIIRFLCFLAVIFPLDYSRISACTSALIGAQASESGRPMLWKHRDTSAADNVVDYIKPDSGSYGYVGLFNADDIKREQVWIGMNDVGFAVMNTASYNIKDDNVPSGKMDREGYLMTEALRSCRTVEDFARLLDTYPRPMGVEANFAAIDCTGAGAFFETNNYRYVRYDVADAPGNVIVRTNYSHSGRPDEGYGFVREANANRLLKPYIENRNITPELLTETISRSFYHDLKGKDYAQGGEKWVIDQDFIPRFKSTATIVIEGCEPVGNPDIFNKNHSDRYIMWTGLGYPPCAEIFPVWCSETGVDIELKAQGKSGHAPAADRAKKRRGEVFPIRKGNGSSYIDMEKLFNTSGTGYVQILVPQNLAVYDLIKKKRGTGDFSGNTGSE